MPTYSDIVKNPRIPRENAGSQANNQNKRRVYNKSNTQRKKQTNTRKPNQPQPPFNFNLYVGNMPSGSNNGIPQILADRALLGLMNSQNIPIGGQNPVNPLPAQPPPVPHILGGGFHADDRQQLVDIVEAQRIFYDEQNNIRNAINNNAFNQERQNQLRDELLANQNNSREYLELVSNQTRQTLDNLRQQTFNTSMNGMRSRRLIETVNNRTTDLENTINTSREEHKKNMEKIQTMFNIMLTPTNDRKALNEAYNKNREELRNNPQGVLDVIFANKERGAPRQSPENEDIEAGARLRTPENFATPLTTPRTEPRTEFSKRTGQTPQGTNFSKRLDMAAGGTTGTSSDNAEISNARNEMVNENTNDISQMDGVDSDDENTDIRNARNEMTNIYVNPPPPRQRFAFQLDDEVTLNTGGAERMEQGMDTSAITDDARPVMNQSGMFLDDSD